MTNGTQTIIHYTDTITMVSLTPKSFMFLLSPVNKSLPKLMVQKTFLMYKMYVGQFNMLIKNENISALVEGVFHQRLGFQR